MGGKGERLKSISKDLPKPLVRINNDPFLSILIKYILNYDFNRIILCAGYGTEYIEDFIETFECDNISLLVSIEEKPLGTGGAIKNAENLIISDDFLVINGDTLFKLDYDEFIDFYYVNNAILTIALLKTFISKNFGTVHINKEGKVISYNEKIPTKNGKRVIVNSGVYLMNKKILNFIPDKSTVSLEYELFPSLIKELNDHVYGFISESEFVDIGTPNNYNRALKIL